MRLFFTLPTALEIDGADSHTSTATSTTGINKSPKLARLRATHSEGKVRVMNESNQDPLAQQDRKSIKITGEQVQTIIEWLSWADKDYVAARRLLLDGLLVQGASLANTAIEKYLKASIVCQGKKVKRGHDPLTTYRQMKPDCTLQLNEKFLPLLAKAYKLRYPDDLEAGYNVVLSQALILDALDQSVKLITSRIVIANSSDGHAVVRLLDNLIAQNDPRVVFNNTALGTVTKDALLSQPSLVYECRVIQKHSYMEAEYSAARIENGNFDREALVQTSEKSFNLTNTPIQ